jgi:hypothetical protein
MNFQPGAIIAALGLSCLSCLPTDALGAIFPTHQRLRGGSRDRALVNRVLQDGSAIYSTAELEFFNACNGELLSDSVLGDGIISQTEFAGKLEQFCEAFTVPVQAGVHFACPGNRFTALSVPLQLLFSETICREDDPMQTRMECLDGLASLNGMGADFGYIVTPETMPEVQMEVENLCLKLLPFIFRKFIIIHDHLSFKFSYIRQAKTCLHLHFRSFRTDTLPFRQPRPCSRVWHHSIYTRSPSFVIRDNRASWRSRSGFRRWRDS